MVKKYLPHILSGAVLLQLLFSPSCANTTEAPTGGPKDSIPPVIVGINPLPGTKNVPLKNFKVTFTFNEYVSIKNAQSITVSPPQEKKLVSKIRGKSLEVRFEEDLLPETTYILDLCDAIGDVNESNPYAGFTYVFSTGSTIDSMYVTGKVFDCKNLDVVKQASVMLYKDHSDSAIFLHKPDYITKTDEWGYFVMPYIKDTLYRIYAVKDESSNNKYDPESDLVGFVDSLCRPSNVVKDSTYELFKFNMKDTLECERRIAEYNILIFKEKQTKQYIKNSGRISDRCGFVSFQADNTWIDSLWIAGYGKDQLVTQFNLAKDSLLIWINDQRPVPDTLHTFVKYRKTDSLGRLVPDIEHLKLYREGYKRKAHASASELKHEDTTCTFKLTALPEKVEEDGFGFTFDLPIKNQHFKNLDFSMINPKQQVSKVKFTVIRDSMDIRNFTVRPSVKMLPGYEYRLKVPDKNFRDIAGNWSDSTEVKVSLPSDDALSCLTVNIINVNAKLIVDLISANETVRSYTIRKDTKLIFPYLKEGDYSIRLSEDGNDNGLIDSGNILLHRQPERVLFYKINSDKVIKIPKSAEIEQTIDYSKL